MKRILRILLLISCPFTAHPTARADTIAQFNFNSVPPDSDVTTGTNVPSFGTGTLLLVGGTTRTYATGSTNDPAASDNSGINTASYPAQGSGNKTAGAQFNVSTVGYSNIVVRWDQRVSGTASKYFRLQYSTDGSTFTDFPTAFAMISSQTTPSSYYESQTNSLAAYAAVNSNANFAVRVVSEWQSTATGSGTAGFVTVSNTTYGTGGTVRFDMFTVSGTLIPGAPTPPSITSVPDQTIRVNQSTAALPVTIGDAQDNATNLVLTKASSDAAVIPDSNIVLGGSGSNRTVSVTATGQTGTAMITVYVSNSAGRSNSTSFGVTVLPLNTAPVISSLSRTNTLVNVATAPMPFTIYDLETPASSLNVAGASGNSALVPPGGITFGGSSSNRTVTITPATGQTGVAVISVAVSDGTNSANSTFPLMVTPSTNVIFYDPFTYADGSVLTNSGFLWANSSGTVGECQVTNGQLQVSSSLTEDVTCALINGPYARSNGFVLYAGFRLKLLSLPKAVPGYFAHFASGSTFRGRVYVGTSNAAAGSFRLQVANDSGTATELPTDLGINTNYTIVTRYALDAAATTMWLNPTNESDPSVTASDSQAAVSISSYDFREDSSVGATLLVDDLRVGLTFAAVLPGASVPSSIPLNFGHTGANIVMSWSDSTFSLQTAPNPSGSFTNIPGARSPFTNTVVGPAKYFRLKAN